MGFGTLYSDGSDATDPEDLIAAADELGTCEGTDTVVCADGTGAAVLLEGNSVRLRLAVALAGAIEEFSTVSNDGGEVVGDKPSDIVATVESSGIGTTGTAVDDSAPAVDDCFVVCSTTRGSVDTGTGPATVDSVGSGSADSGALEIDESELGDMLIAFSDTEELFTATAVEPAGVTGTSSDNMVELAAVSLVVVVVIVGTSRAGVLTAAVGISTDVDEISSGNNVELAATVLTMDVGISEEVGAGTEISSTDEDGVSEDRAGRVVLMALEGRMTTPGLLSAAFSDVLSVVPSMLGVLSGLSGRSTGLLIDVVVGVGVGDGIVVGWLEEVVEVGTTMDVGMLDEELDEVIDGSVSLSKDSKSSANDTGTGGMLKELVADRVPFVTIWRLTCLRRYLGLSAPPCPAGAAAVAGLSVASTARDAAKTIDDLRTIAVSEYFDIIYIIRFW